MGFFVFIFFFFFNIIFFFFWGGALNQKIVPKQTSTDMFHYNTNVYECEKKRLMVMKSLLVLLICYTKIHHFFISLFLSTLNTTSYFCNQNITLLHHKSIYPGMASGVIIPK